VRPFPLPPFQLSIVIAAINRSVNANLSVERTKRSALHQMQRQLLQRAIEPLLMIKSIVPETINRGLSESKNSLSLSRVHQRPLTRRHASTTGRLLSEMSAAWTAGDNPRRTSIAPLRRRNKKLYIRRNLSIISDNVHYYITSLRNRCVYTF